MNIRILYFLAFSMSSLLAFLLPIIPIYALYLGASQFMLGLIGAVGAFSYAFFCLFLGRVRRFLGCVSVALSFAGFGVFCCLFPLVASSEPIPLLMLLQGLSTSFFWPSVEVLVKDASKKSRVGDSSSNYSFSWSAGAVAGSLASGFALEFNKLQLAFVFVSIVSFALAAVSAYTIRGNRVYDSFGPDSISGLNARHIFLEFKWVWLSIFIYALVQGIVFSLFPAYAEIKSVPKMFIGFIIFSIMIGRTASFILFNRMPIRVRENGLEFGMLLMCLGSTPLFLTTNPLTLSASSFLLGFGLGLLYLKSFQTIISQSGGIGLYTSIFEGVIGVGSSLSLLGGFMAEKWLEAPYIIISIASFSTFIILLFLKHKIG